MIVGAGPTGLGAAWRLEELGHRSWTMFESGDSAGGLACSVVDDAGFTWDIGGHVLFSHYPYFDRVMDAALGSAWISHEREAWVWMRDRWIPYPFQNNLWRLPEKDVLACIEGLLDLQATGRAGGAGPATFEEWLLQSFGAGLCDVFMFPYNRKVWAYPPDRLDVGWMRERVATVDLRRVLRNLVLRRDDVGWGPNATFRFPEHGGTGAIWEAVRRRLPAEHLRFGRRVVAVRTREKRITLDDGTGVPYDHLISTMPLDRLLAMLEDRPDLTPHATKFVHSSSHVVGIGMEGAVPDALRTKCWMYFPESNAPFYRVTVFSNYSPNNVARPGLQWSLMAEVSESPEKPVDSSAVVQQTIDGLRNCRLVPDGTPIVSAWHRRLEYGYPTPWLGRDAVLGAVEPELRAAGILSRGRFGAWRYEVSNQDHSMMQGVEAVDHVLRGEEEKTCFARAGTS